ncbi:hypothetical protein PSHT_01745 [Puccinia striiformis]|uniref:Uncharacterized protein n=1 Tax=Puccinia striiformis TaxID=27350 RepID=A0A2S4WJN8_9BASI|nr:hypothetical protein PSHT_01745 [Puccinia striiformis]
MDCHKKTARHQTKLAQLNAFYQMTAAGLRGSTNKNRPDRQSPPGGPPSDIDIDNDYMTPEDDDESEEDDDQGIDPAQFGYSHLESDSESDGRLDEEDWSLSGEQTLGEDFEPNEQDIPTTGSTSRPQRTRRFLQVHLGILFPAWMISNPRAVAQHHVSQLVQPSTSYSNPVPRESASLGHP